MRLSLNFGNATKMLCSFDGCDYTAEPFKCMAADLDADHHDPIMPSLNDIHHEATQNGQDGTIDVGDQEQSKQTLSEDRGPEGEACEPCEPATGRTAGLCTSALPVSILCLLRGVVPPGRCQDVLRRHPVAPRGLGTNVGSRFRSCWAISSPHYMYMRGGLLTSHARLAAFPHSVSCWERLGQFLSANTRKS